MRTAKDWEFIIDHLSDCDTSLLDTIIQIQKEAIHEAIERCREKKGNNWCEINSKLYIASIDIMRVESEMLKEI
jgi:hypothetical protein